MKNRRLVVGLLQWYCCFVHWLYYKVNTIFTHIAYVPYTWLHKFFTMVLYSFKTSCSPFNNTIVLYCTLWVLIVSTILISRSKSPPHHSRSRYHRSRSSSSDSSSSSSSSSRTPSPVKKRPAKPSTSEKESSSKKPAGTKVNYSSSIV